MSFFDWLTTGSSHGILLEQEKRACSFQAVSAVFKFRFFADSAFFSWI